MFFSKLLFEDEHPCMLSTRLKTSLLEASGRWGVERKVSVWLLMVQMLVNFLRPIVEKAARLARQCVLMTAWMSVRKAACAVERAVGRLGSASLEIAEIRLQRAR